MGDVVVEGRLGGGAVLDDHLSPPRAEMAVVVSVGAGNRYRHPDPGLIGGLERAGAAVRAGARDVARVSEGLPAAADRPRGRARLGRSDTRPGG
jgi:hypothetical protein